MCTQELVTSGLRLLDLRSCGATICTAESYSQHSWVAKQDFRSSVECAAAVGRLRAQMRGEQSFEVRLAVLEATRQMADVDCLRLLAEGDLPEVSTVAPMLVLLVVCKQLRLLKGASQAAFLLLWYSLQTSRLSA